MGQLLSYLKIIMRRGWIVLLAIILLAGVAFGISTYLLENSPVYQSTVQVLISPARSDFGQAQAAKTLLNSYVAWLDSNYRAAEVIDRLDLTMTPEQLRSDVSFAADDLRLVVKIEVENSNGDTANDIARTWADLLIEWRNEENQKNRREDRIDATRLDDPRYALDSPKRAINTAAGGIAGLLIGLLIVFLMEFSASGTIRTTADIERFLAVPVLAAVPPESKRGQG